MVILGIFLAAYGEKMLAVAYAGVILFAFCVFFQLVTLPVVVGIAYEFNRFVGAHDNFFTAFLASPGMWMQKFTTYEPDDSMIEVAIEALKRVIPEEKGKDKW